MGFTVLNLEDYLFQFTFSLISHAVLVVYLFVIMGARGRQAVRKLLRIKRCRRIQKQFSL